MIEINIEDQCLVPLAGCRYAPDGFYLYEQDKDLKPGWSHFNYENLFDPCASCRFGHALRRIFVSVRKQGKL